MNHTKLLTDIYIAFNDRNIETVLSHLHPEVVWPNGWEGGTIIGRDAVREYWLRQWAEIEPEVHPTSFSIEADGRVAATVHQIVKDKHGKTLVDTQVIHVYAFAGDVIATMEIRS